MNHRAFLIPMFAALFATVPFAVSAAEGHDDHGHDHAPKATTNPEKKKPHVHGAHEEGESEDEHGHSGHSAHGGGDEVSMSATVARTFGIVSEPAQARSLAAIVMAPGWIIYDPAGQAHIATPTAGRIVTVRAQVGDAVKTGDPLIEIISPAYVEAQSAYILKRASAMAADNHVETAKAVVERGRKAADGISGAELQRREAELLQCALRGRPFDHPDVQITLLFSLPVPGLTPTVICEAPQRPESNGGRELAVKERLCAAAQQLLERGVRVIDVALLAEAAQTSVVVTRKHWRHVATRLHLAMYTRRRTTPMPRGGARSVARMVLVRRGRVVPPQRLRPESETSVEHQNSSEPHSQASATRDHARDHISATRLIRHRRRPERQARHRRGVRGMYSRNEQGGAQQGTPEARKADHGPAP